MNYVKVILIISLIFYSCNKIDSNNIENRIAENIVKLIIENDSLKSFNYSSEVFLHIKSQKLNKNSFRTYVTLNGTLNESVQGSVQKLNIDGFETIVYYSEDSGEFDLPNPFWVLHSKHWNFITEVAGNELVSYQLNRIYPENNNEIEDTFEIDF